MNPLSALLEIGVLANQLVPLIDDMRQRAENGEGYTNEELKALYGTTIATIQANIANNAAGSGQDQS